MSERITRANLDERVANLNRRMEHHGSTIRYQIQGRNGYIGLDRFTRSEDSVTSWPDSVPGRGIGWDCLSTVTNGTKREVADFLHAMMVVLDDVELYRK
jgi:hypothetical protein